MWKPRVIDNPGYFELDSPAFLKISPIYALGFELWTVGNGIYYDNIIITGELTAASAFARDR